MLFGSCPLLAPLLETIFKDSRLPFIKSLTLLKDSQVGVYPLYLCVFERGPPLQVLCLGLFVYEPLSQDLLIWCKYFYSNICDLFLFYFYFSLFSPRNGCFFYISLPMVQVRTKDLLLLMLKSTFTYLRNFTYFSLLKIRPLYTGLLLINIYSHFISVWHYTFLSSFYRLYVSNNSLVYFNHVRLFYHLVSFIL